jgi:hypothetical protein
MPICKDFFQPPTIGNYALIFNGLSFFVAYSG